MQQLVFELLTFVEEGASVASAVRGSLTACCKLSFVLLGSLVIAKSHKNHNIKIIIKTKVQNQKVRGNIKINEQNNLIRKLHARNSKLMKCV